MNEVMEEQVISIEEIFNCIKKRWKIIMIITVVSTLISVIFSFFIIKPQYEASTKVFIGKEESSTEGYNNNDVVMYQKLLKTYSETIKTKKIVNSAIKNTDYDKEADAVLQGLTVIPVTDTQILQIKYKDSSPIEAQELLQAISDEFIKTAKKLVPNGNISIIEEVERPINPISPNKKMNIAVAFLLGVMIGLGLVFLLEFLDNTYRSKELMENELELPVLGVIPRLDN